MDEALTKFESFVSRQWPDDDCDSVDSIMTSFWNALSSNNASVVFSVISIHDTEFYFRRVLSAAMRSIERHPFQIGQMNMYGRLKVNLRQEVDKSDILLSKRGSLEYNGTSDFNCLSDSNASSSEIVEAESDNEETWRDVDEDESMGYVGKDLSEILIQNKKFSEYEVQNKGRIENSVQDHCQHVLNYSEICEFNQYSICHFQQPWSLLDVVVVLLGFIAHSFNDILNIPSSIGKPIDTRELKKEYEEAIVKYMIRHSTGQESF